MNKVFLNLVMIPSALWRSLGADIPQLRAILNAKLMLDDRKPYDHRAYEQAQDRPQVCNTHE